MASFNELMVGPSIQSLYRSYPEFQPEVSANISSGLLIIISLISVFFFMITVTYNAKTTSITSSISNLIVYIFLAGVASLTLSFSILFVASHLGVYT